VLANRAPGDARPEQELDQAVRRIISRASEAGVASAEITTHRGTAQFSGIRTMVEADLRGWLPVMGVVLSEDQIDRILQEAKQALSSYAAADGRATFHLSAHLVTARKH
jgi:hypothetical protein